jgi:hypothetical protein
MSKSQGQSSETHWKLATLEHSQVEMVKYRMDFIVGLACTSRGYNSIWVIVDRLTKSAHFIPVSTTYRVRQYAKLYLSSFEILKTIFYFQFFELRKAQFGSVEVRTSLKFKFKGI